MAYIPENNQRWSIRLREYDYSQPGVYFVTIVTQERECLFGEIVDAEMRLNDWGKATEECWMAIPNHFPHVQIDVYAILRPVQTTVSNRRWGIAWP